MLHLEGIAAARWSDDDIDRHVEAEVPAGKELAPLWPARCWAEDEWLRDEYRESQLD
jgi:hypothetical protein